MKSAKKNMKRKPYYTGVQAIETYSGSKTQPGYAGRAAGSKLARKARRNRVGARVVGVVSAALENIAKGKRLSQ